VSRAFALCALLVACAPAGAQELGRLFYSPEQRQALDARRQARVPDKPAPVVAAAPTVRLDGYVKRSGGRSTVWVNGEPAEDAPVLPASSDGPVPVTIGETGARIGLKPGQSVDRGTNEPRDVIGDGEIKIRRKGP
jgi:hypothetical protein